jgi:DNA invertase Pin-like site-specific DNA recombinase
MIYGYVRISTKKQSIQRQINNILREYPKAKIIEETFTGTTVNRPEWNKLKKRIKKGNTVVFDSVSRMSRNSKEGIEEYRELYNLEINLIFIKEPYINTDLYKDQLKAYENIKTEEEDLEPLFKGIQETLNRLAEKQIKIAFEQSEKEVEDLKKLGHKKKTLITKKSIECKIKIQKISQRYQGIMNDKETIEMLGISRNTFYKYIKEI